VASEKKKDKINEVNIVVHGTGSAVVKSNEESLDKCYEICDEIIRNMLGVLKGTEEEFNEKKRKVGII